MRINNNSPREIIVKRIKVVTKMTIILIRTPLRVKENGGEKLSIYEYILKLSTAYGDRLDVDCERKRGVKDDFKVLS